MRLSAVLGLLAVAGCNQLFGLDKTQLGDASVSEGIDPLLPRVKLRHVVATTNAQLMPQPLAAVPIAPPPAVKVGPLDGPLIDAVYEDDGRVAYPEALGAATWRLEYTLEDGIPREVQWRPAEARGDLAVPLFGRHDRTEIPTGSGYVISPTPTPTGGSPMRLYTVGLWSLGVFLWTGVQASYSVLNAMPLGGRLGAPDPTQGDGAMLASYVNDGTCQVVSGAGYFQAPLVANDPSEVAPVFHTSRNVFATFGFGSPGRLALQARLDTALGDRGGTGGAPRVEYGRIPSRGMPAFTGRSNGFQLPIPLIVPFANCNAELAATPQFVEPQELSSLPPAMHVQLIATRTPPNAPTLTSGLQELVLSDDAFEFELDVAMAVSPITLAGGAPVLDLSGPSDDVATTVTGPLALTFALGTEPSLTADYFDVTLFRIVDASTLTPVRVYTVTAPAVSIDPAAVVDGGRYVLEIRSHRGHPDAALGDFAKVVPPQVAASIYTRTFVIAK